MPLPVLVTTWEPVLSLPALVTSWESVLSLPALVSWEPVLSLPVLVTIGGCSYKGKGKKKHRTVDELQQKIFQLFFAVLVFLDNILKVY